MAILGAVSSLARYLDLEVSLLRLAFLSRSFSPHSCYFLSRTMPQPGEDIYVSPAESEIEQIENHDGEIPLSDDSTPRNPIGATDIAQIEEALDVSSPPNPLTDRKIQLLQDDCMDELGFTNPAWKKWIILSVVFLVQLSMNFNTSIYSNAIGHAQEKFQVSAQAARRLW
jgi:hypothetical protein